ncbi:PhzF family phenazine biosynthesis protein [Actinomadura sp. DC4]|uniref:PhzF family phenazine biosynthesis protein n=1 Tax=Actinomadura sp. DC4 TaxID=3055069 RepID=UPI0025B1138C|nr:PhzF family phenazine biosynthesis protein [Actinomadura sp. DC4]MDN3358733.1 PhzF family phenazine biosynthesis protein [Actinomadura sp. DC4]
MTAIVHACLRDGHGGSPTAVLDDVPLSDDERCRVPVAMGTSHAVFVQRHAGPVVGLRFFTSGGELPACGHGTVAALAYLADHTGLDDYQATVQAGGRVFNGRAVRRGTHFDATFDAGPVGLREATAGECALVLPALGDVAGGARVAEIGRERLLVPVATRSALAALTPDLDRLRAACDRLGLLGCYVYSPPTSEGRLAARMFAPSIGVAEDVANANSTACLAAHLAGPGAVEIAVDMGDSLGSPATITARGAAPIRVGGAARVTSVRRTPGG